MPDRLKPIDRRRTAQHTDIFVVELHEVVPAQAQGVEPGPGQGRELHGVPAHLIEDGCDLRSSSPVDALVFFQQQTHKIVDLDGWMGQSGEPAPLVRRKLGHEIVVPVEPETLGVGEGPAGSGKAAGVVAQCHAGRDFQHDIRGGAGRFLAGIDRRRELGVAEHIHNALIADAVAAAELPVGVVIGHAPAETACHALLGNGVVEDGGIAQSLCQTVGFIVKRLGRELCALKFADEIAFPGVGGDGGAGLAPHAPAPVGVVAVGINVLEELAAAGAPGAGSGPGGVEAVDRLVGALVEALIVGAATDPDAPEEDTGMAAVLADHLPAVLQGLGLPGIVADVLPAGHLHEDQQAQLVAGVQKRRAGRCGEPDGIAAQLLFQQLCVQTLNTVGHGIALIWKALAAVQAPQLHPLAVEVEPTRHELQGAEAEPAALFVQNPVGQAAGAGPDEPDREGVEGGVLDAPRMDIVQGTVDGQGKLTGVESPTAGGAADLGL